MAADGAEMVALAGEAAVVEGILVADSAEGRVAAVPAETGKPVPVAVRRPP